MKEDTIILVWGIVLERSRVMTESKVPANNWEKHPELYDFNSLTSGLVCDLLWHWLETGVKIDHSYLMEHMNKDAYWWFCEDYKNMKKVWEGNKK
jgi:hypothetical protein